MQPTEQPNTLRGFTFWGWTSRFLLAYGGCQLIVVLLIGLAAGVPVRHLLLPFVLLLSCGFVGAGLIFWARQRYDARNAGHGAARFAFAIFCLVSLYMGTLLVSAVDLGILSATQALEGYAPYILPSSAIASSVIYAMARRRLQLVRAPNARLHS